MQETAINYHAFIINDLYIFIHKREIPLRIDTLFAEVFTNAENTKLESVLNNLVHTKSSQLIYYHKLRQNLYQTFVSYIVL